MKINITPPLCFEQATNAVKSAEAIWNNGDLEIILSLFNDNCEWRDNDQHIHGKQGIYNLLHKKQADEDFNSVRAELWSYSFCQLTISFQSEWQNAETGQWFRTGGHVFARLDSTGLIREFSLSSTGKAIRANSRSIGVNKLVGHDD